MVRSRPGCTDVDVVTGRDDAKRSLVAASSHLTPVAFAGVTWKHLTGTEKLALQILPPRNATPPALVTNNQTFNLSITQAAAQDTKAVDGCHHRSLETRAGEPAARVMHDSAHQ
jgi:hypothetical protein